MHGDLPMTTLGRTGLKVTRLGIGGYYCPTPEGYRAALDCGVNYLDTAHNYRDGDDEKTIGKAIAGRRDQLILATKSGKRDAASARQELETSLRSLDTDYVDIWQIHCLESKDELGQVWGPSGVLETALKAREEGLIRFIGVAAHDWEVARQAVATDLFDTLLCWYNCAMKEPEEMVFPHTLAHQTGVVIMNATRTDKLLADFDDPTQRVLKEDFYRYVLSHEAVHVVLMGLRDVHRFQQVARALQERATLDPIEKARLEEYGSRMRAAGKLD